MANDLITIPYVVYEQEKVHQHKTNVRWFIITLVLIFALVASNVAWFIYESQFEIVEDTVEQYEYEITQECDDGNNNFVGHDGDIVNGEADDKG